MPQPDITCFLKRRSMMDATLPVDATNIQVGCNQAFGCNLDLKEIRGSGSHVAPKEASDINPESETFYKTTGLVS